MSMHVCYMCVYAYIHTHTLPNAYVHDCTHVHAHTYADADASAARVSNASGVEHALEKILQQRLTGRHLEDLRLPPSYALDARGVQHNTKPLGVVGRPDAAAGHQLAPATVRRTNKFKSRAFNIDFTVTTEDENIKQFQIQS